MSLNYKIKSVRFYQAVSIDNAQTTYITNPEYMSVRTDKPKSEISTNDKGIVIETANDLLLVSWNNIASIHFDKNAPLEEEVKKKK